MTQQPHVHGPDCNHDHDHHDHDHGHVHGPNCGHAHQEPVRNTRWSQRPLPMRQREEIQEVPRGLMP